MKRPMLSVWSLVVATLLLAGSAQAQTALVTKKPLPGYHVVVGEAANTDDSQVPAQLPEEVETPRFGLGGHAQGQLAGVSGLYSLNNRFTIQGFLSAVDLGLFGDATVLMGRGLYDLRQARTHDWYIYGAAMVISGAASGTGFGGGGGVEVNLREALSAQGFPPLYGLADLGLFTLGDAGSVWSVGLALHYRF